MSLVPDHVQDRESDLTSFADLSGLNAYLRQLLDGFDAATAAPGAEPNGRRSSLRGFGQLDYPLAPEVARELFAVSARHQLATHSVLRAAWAVLVARYSGDNDVLFGVATRADQALDDASRAVLPFRVRVPGDLCVRDFLTTVHALCLAGRPYEDVELLEVEGELALRSLMLESVLRVDWRAPSAAYSREARDAVRAPERSAPLELHVLGQLEGEVSLRLSFDRSRFRAGMAERLVDAFVFVLEQLLTNDERLLHRVHVLRPEARHRLVTAFNATERDFPRQLLIHERFEQQARARPDAIAVETQTSSVSYRELEALANRLAHALRARGAGPGVRIAICLERGVLLVAAMLAVSKSGAAYVPLEPAYPAERLQRIVSDAAPAVVVTEASCADRFASELLFADALELATLPATPPELVATSEDDCYVIYTSGSTGAPKGVVLQHRAVTNTCEWVTREFGIGPGDRLLFVTSACFDLSVYDVFGALGAGATVVVAEQRLLADAAALGRAVHERNVTIWNSAPAVLELVMPFVARAPLSGRLRLVMLSGDFIPLALVALVKSTFPCAKLISLGGATEAAIWSNFYPVGELEPDWVSVPYGRPLQNCRYYALDARLEPVPLGAVGELCIGGECLARGYLNQPELTAAKFVPNPFSDAPGDRLYRTGDLVRYFEDGNLEILGRADGQVKIRGYRVELLEIEAALLALAGVAQAVCIATKLDSSGHRSLVAYVVPKAGATLSELGIKRDLAQALPEFMLPARVALLGALPLSANGKLDRTALRAPDEFVPLAEASVPPFTETERVVAESWGRILNRSAIGRDDDF
ncbi:MAG TPA: amino acid adenylation domain-containing protein, partial [Polyangiaceae bacterium]|nr:amino acid adenylation domain-containing protein [Polyangiaceae bacterium]